MGTGSRRPAGRKKSAVKYLPFADLTPGAVRRVQSLPRGTLFTIEGTGKFFRMVRAGNTLRPRIVKVRKVKK